MTTPPLPQVREGDVLAGRYRIGALIGVGGYGQVYRATQLPLGREVAIKVVNENDRELFARFEREATIARKLEHPNTVRVLDYGTTPDGFPFIALELLRGSSVHELLGAWGSLDADVALEVTAQVLKSLAEAHALGIVHRDIKPENVFVTSHVGEPVFVKLLDFGIAKEIRSTEKQLTVNGEAVGTPNYMSPEQVMGMATDGRSDLYAVGLMLAEMVTGNTVFEGGPKTLIHAQLGQAPVPLEAAVRGSIVGPIVERAVQRRPRERYQSAEEMLVEVEAALLRARRDRISSPEADRTESVPESVEPSPKLAPPTRVVEPTLQPAAQRGFAPIIQQPPIPSAVFVALFVGGAIIVLLMAVVAILWMRPPQRDDRRPPEDEDAVPRKRADKSPRNVLDPRAKALKTKSISAIRRAVIAAGYEITVDGPPENGNVAHTLVVQKLPCVGPIVMMDLGDAETLQRTAKSTLATGAGVLVDGTTMVMVSINSAHASPDLECTRAVTRLLGD